jgi:hypothetical protein
LTSTSGQAASSHKSNPAVAIAVHRRASTEPSFDGGFFVESGIASMSTLTTISSSVEQRIADLGRLPA